MKLNFTILAFLLLSINICHAQKVKIKNDIAIVDGADYLKWKKILLNNEVSISALDTDEEEISAMYLDYNDANEISSSNPNGTVRWIEIYFPTLDLRCEISSTTSKGMVKSFLQNNLYVDGKLNAENVQKFVKKYGMKFSENRPKNNVNVIINN